MGVSVEIVPFRDGLAISSLKRGVADATMSGNMLGNERVPGLAMVKLEVLAGQLGKTVKVRWHDGRRA